jgi:hypothetical protein
MTESSPMARLDSGNEEVTTVNTLIIAITMAGALAATFGIAYCFVWLCLRSFMAWMQSHAARPARVEARAAARSGLLRRFAFGQKH